MGKLQTLTKDFTDFALPKMPMARADLCVVLGSGVNSFYTAQKAAELLSEHKVRYGVFPNRIIASGAVTRDCAKYSALCDINFDEHNLSEAKFIQAVLQNSLGEDCPPIELDEEAHNTLENIKNCIDLSLTNIHSIMLVTLDFHRVRVAAHIGALMQKTDHAPLVSIQGASFNWASDKRRQNRLAHETKTLSNSDYWLGGDMGDFDWLGMIERLKAQQMLASAQPRQRYG